MVSKTKQSTMGLLTDTYNYALRMHRECRESFPSRRLQRKPLVSDPGMHHGTCVTHVTWCVSGSLTRGGGKNVPGIPGACASRNVTYLVYPTLTVFFTFSILFMTQPPAFLIPTSLFYWKDRNPQSQQNTDVTWPASAVIAQTYYGDVIMGTMASQITSLVIVYSTV